ncbi:MAG TPA: lipoate--protein ligase [Acholeplasmataceae bacterium]|nr:lipoate--protein ligase [Acholeplasmataceae bacterium]
MLTIINNSTNPYYNLALEEYVLKHIKSDEDFILLWQNKNAIIVGRNQNTFAEINYQYVKEHNIDVVRRTSGGGAVYHDLGNLNFTFITKNIQDNLNNYRKFTEPVIAALNKLGVPAEFSGRNDILVDGKKISGNAQTFYKDRMLHHGTILFNANLEMVSKVLNVNIEKLQSKGIKSNRSRVTNIYPYIKTKITIKEFIIHLLKHFLGNDYENRIYKLTNEDLENIEKLKNEKYMTWEWNFGESPEMDIQKQKRFLGGQVQFNFNVNEGIIKDCKIYGDFFGKENISDIEKSLIGVPFRENDLYEALNKIKLDDYFFNITIDDLISCIFY